MGLKELLASDFPHNSEVGNYSFMTKDRVTHSCITTMPQSANQLRPRGTLLFPHSDFQKYIPATIEGVPEGITRPHQAHAANLIPFTQCGSPARSPGVIAGSERERNVVVQEKRAPSWLGQAYLDLHMDGSH